MNTKWQRIRYMPATPLGSDGRRVTGSSEHINLSRRAATEGMVLLKNSNGLLPLPLGKRIAVFGKAQVDYVKGGGGSGDVTVAYVHTLLDGLSIKQEEGKIELFDPLSHFYSEDVQKQFRAGCAPGKTTEPALPEALLTQARSFTDTALITLCRYSCEDSDRTGIPGDGDFYLSRQEELMVSQVEGLFPHIIVVLNTGGIMDTSWFRDSDRIGAALLGWQAGMEGGLATADILVGDVCPSGHLTDTFAEAFEDYPSSATFAESEDYVTYDEDIFVGYRFFETIPGAARKVCYPFGYGLSYTSFALSNLTGGMMESGDVQVTCRVTNTGHVSGKQVIQLYGEAPQGKLGKPSRVLCAFAKTKLLAPGDFEDILLSVNPYLLASYDDEGLVARSAYVLEAGDYHFYLGDNVRDVEKVPYTMTIDKDRIVRQLSPRCMPHNLHRRLRADGTYTPVQADGRAADNGVDHAVVPSGYPVITRSIPKEPQAGTLLDAAENRLTLDRLVDSLNDAQLVHLLGGQPNRGVADTCGFGNLPECSVPNAMTADGPAGLRIKPDRGVTTTAFPCATLLCCTWNPQIVEAVGCAGAREAAENGIAVWLTPAINIHRTPLCGRNFEYYSEDPYLAGRMAAAMVRGIQSQGVAASVKHFCCNNKETNRHQSDSCVSERALREIYLKPFELCICEAHPWTLMSSYNLLNGERTSQSRDLLTGILRDEWGFQGVVTTDWWTNGEQWREVAAGNDLKMPLGNPEHTLRMLQDGKLSREDVKMSVKRILGLFMKLA